CLVVASSYFSSSAVQRPRKVLHELRGSSLASERLQGHGLKISTSHCRTTFSDKASGVSDLYRADSSECTIDVATVGAELYPGVSINRVGPDELVCIYTQAGRSNLPSKLSAALGVKLVHPERCRG